MHANANDHRSETYSTVRVTVDRTDKIYKQHSPLALSRFLVDFYVFFRLRCIYWQWVVLGWTGFLYFFPTLRVCEGGDRI